MEIGGITPAHKLKMAAYVLRMHPAKNGRITLPTSGVENHLHHKCDRKLEPSDQKNY
jgi:hypothetical protein